MPDDGARIAALSSRVAGAEPERDAVQPDAEAQQTILALKAQLTAVRAELAFVRAERDMVMNSSIWRATAPLRRLGKATPAWMRGAIRQTLRAGFRRAGLPHTATQWYARYRAGTDYAAILWRGAVPFSVVMPVYKVRPDWLQDAIASVVAQTYPHWELICVDDGAQDSTIDAILREAALAEPRIRHVTLPCNQGVSAATNAGLAKAGGDYVLFMDHDDLLEPHALARLADAAFVEESDIVYADEVVTGEDADDILAVQARPAFSYSYYLCYPFFVHPVAVRTSLARRVGGLDESLAISQDIDFVLRALEAAHRVTHVPDILYRWRTNRASAGHRQQNAVMATTCALKTAHLRRLGFGDAEVSPGASFNTYRVSYFAHPTGRVLAIVPTHNRVDLLRRCVDTFRATTQGLRADLLIVDHESDDPATIAYLRALESSGAARVMPFRGKFNFSRLNNEAVAAHGAGYDYFLFMNNDIEASKPGWLPAMLDLAMLGDVGAVGATLLYPDGRVQHAGVVVGLCGPAEHAYKTVPFASFNPGYGCGLHATRDYSAVTAACMLVPAEAFRAVQGFNEALEIGFNDTDFCLRLGRQGYRVLNSAEAVLLHHESASRGQRRDGRDHHVRDTSLFRTTHSAVLQAGDRHMSPLLDRNNPAFALAANARLAATVEYDTVTGFLPRRRRAG